MGTFTRLEAINRMLRAASEAPVTSLTDDGVNDVAIAEALLRETTLLKQMEGLHTNTTIEVRFPTDAGIILLAPDVLRADATGVDAGRRVTIRGRGAQTRLFDLDNNTFTFTSPITLEIVLGLPFEDLPAPHQAEIMDEAARIYQMQTSGDTSQDRLLSEVAANSRRVSRAEETRQSDVNITNNPTSRNIRDPWRTRRPQRGGWYGSSTRP